MCCNSVQAQPFIVRILLLAILPLNVIVNVFAFIAPFWKITEKIESGDTIKYFAGIWMICQKGYLNKKNEFQTGYTCYKHNDYKDWFDVSRSFMVVGCVCTLLALLGVVFFVLRGKGLRVITACNIISTIGAMSTTATVSIYGVAWKLEKESNIPELSGCYYLACISAFISLLTVILISSVFVNYYSGSYDDDESLRKDFYPPMNMYGGGFNDPRSMKTPRDGFPHDRPNMGYDNPQYNYGRFPPGPVPGPVRY